MVDEVQVDLDLPTRTGLAKLAETTDFARFVELLFDGLDIASKGIKNLRKYDRIMRTIEKAIAEDAKDFAVEEAEHELLLEALKLKNWTWPKLGRLYLPFIDAIENAEELTTANDKKKRST
jgi:hypothetical protein